MKEELLGIVNTVRTNKGLAIVGDLSSETHLRRDLGFDSFDLAEFTVRVEDVWKVDIFADGVVNTVGEVMHKIERWQALNVGSRSER